jgi:hypothetical protein
MRGKDMKKSKQIKDMSIYEASEFWDEHDFSEFEDVKEVKEMQFSLIKKRYIGLDIDLYIKVKRKAKEMHKTEDTLINEWLKEKVEA